MGSGYRRDVNVRFCVFFIIDEKCWYVYSGILIGGFRVLGIFYLFFVVLVFVYIVYFYFVVLVFGFSFVWVLVCLVVYFYF